jgi:redox-sensitive bicupin YhaK (pirin superfamily)
MSTAHVPDDPAVALVLSPRPRPLGGGSVRRVLPHALRRLVGPFIFFDHFGPGLVPGHINTDVRPHPHIGLSTVTWLFEGRSTHRDSLGCVQEILPGSINLMTAGRGIVHSERTPEDLQGKDRVSHGLQLWLALPAEVEDCEPSFAHHAADELPELGLPGARAKVLIGRAWGAVSPVRVPSETLYVDLELQPGAQIELPAAEERAVYVVSGRVRLGQTWLEEAHLGIVGEPARLSCEEAARVVIIGGAKLDGPRHIWWNFVATTPERIAEAAARWAEGKFPTVPGDDEEYIPLPDEPYVAGEARW